MMMTALRDSIVPWSVTVCGKANKASIAAVSNDVIITKLRFHRDSSVKRLLISMVSKHDSYVISLTFV